jgi:hypothetical protein
MAAAGFFAAAEPALAPDTDTAFKKHPSMSSSGNTGQGRDVFSLDQKTFVLIISAHIILICRAVLFAALP